MVTYPLELEVTGGRFLEVVDTIAVIPFQQCDVNTGVKPDGRHVSQGLRHGGHVVETERIALENVLKSFALSNAAFQLRAEPAGG